MSCRDLQTALQMGGRLSCWWASCPLCAVVCLPAGICTTQLRCAWRGASAYALCAMQAAAAALPELAVALAAEEGEAELLVSVLSCLSSDLLACGRLHSLAVLHLSWGIRCMPW